MIHKTSPVELLQATLPIGHQPQNKANRCRRSAGPTGTLRCLRARALAVALDFVRYYLMEFRNFS
jgi:hypothetical protein